MARNRTVPIQVSTGQHLKDDFTWSSVQPLDATLTALAAYNTNGLIAQTAADTFAGRTLTAAAGLAVSNGDGVAGNPTVRLGSGQMVSILHPEGSMPPGTLYATFDTRAGGSTPAESVSVLDFDDTAAEYADWKVRMPDSYNGGGITLSLEWSATSATTNDVLWGAAIRRIVDDAEDIDGAHTYDYNNATADTTASATGETSKASIVFTDGADMDSWAAGETAIVRVRRLPTDGADTMAGDAELWNCYIKET